GGQFALGNDQVIYQPTRLALPACVGANPTAGGGPTGKDSLLLVATGVGPAGLAKSAYKRIVGASDADIAALPPTTLYLGGESPTTVPTATLPSLALIANEDASRGPCLELYLSRLLAAGGDCPQAVMDDFTLDCDCSGNATCSAGGAVELSRTIDV